MSVSVIIPVYNRAELIGETLQAIRAQTMAPDEIIVVDDGSSDDSANVAQGFGDDIQVIRSENRGAAHARNLGLARARGGYIQFMDSDDLPTPHFIESRLDKAEKTSADIVYGPWLPACIARQTVRFDGFVRQAAETANTLDAYLKGWILFLPNALIKRSLIDAAGGYPEEFITGEDMLLLFRLLSLTDNIAYTDRSLLLVRQHPEGQLSANSELAKQRAIDDLKLTETVTQEINKYRWPITASTSAKNAWRRRTALAHERLALLSGPSDGNKVERNSVFLTLSTLKKRVEKRFQSILHGHSVDPIFAVQKISNFQTKEIEALGYKVTF